MRRVVRLKDFRPVRRFPAQPPPRRNRLAAMLRRMADPVFYLRAVILAGVLGLVVLPLLADGTLAVMRPMTEGSDRCRVIQVTDGDTLRLWCRSGPVAARLMGFDAPELFSPGCAAELLAAEKAKWALRRALAGASELSITRHGTDRWDRALVRLRLDGRDIAAIMIAGGHGRPYAGGLRRGWCGAGG